MRHSVLCGLAAITAAAGIYFPGTAYGEESKTENLNEIKIDSPFVLSGVHTNAFQLKSNTDYIFQVEDCVPGDRIEAVIEAENTTNEPFDLALVSIQSKLKDTALFDALELTISHNQDVLYEGAYHPDNVPMTKYLTVEAGEKICLDVSVLLPKEVGNDLQDTQMKSTWLFEAKHAGESKHPVKDADTADKDAGPDAVKTGVELEKSNLASRIFAILGLILFGFGAVLILRAGKKNN